MESFGAQLKIKFPPCECCRFVPPKKCCKLLEVYGESVENFSENGWKLRIFFYNGLKAWKALWHLDEPRKHFLQRMESMESFMTTGWTAETVSIKDGKHGKLYDTWRNRENIFYNGWKAWKAL
jgi:hypothetical protein